MPTMKYISPFCRIIQVSLDGMLMNSTQYRAAATAPETYETTDDSGNWN